MVFQRGEHRGVLKVIEKEILITFTREATESRGGIEACWEKVEKKLQECGGDNLPEAIKITHWDMIPREPTDPYKGITIGYYPVGR